MSVRLMTAAWAADVGSTDKIVLLALADHANDDGYCWPGNSSLCKKCGLSERAVRMALASLEAAGHITRHFVTGKSTSYHIHPGTTCPRQDMPPAPHAETPAPRAPKSSRTINPSSSDEGKKERGRTNRGCRLPSDWMPAPLPADFLPPPAGLMERELSKFKDYWAAKPGAGGVKLDWDATWRNWLRKASETNNGNSMAGHNGRAADRQYRASPGLEWAKRQFALGDDTGTVEAHAWA